MDFTVVIVFGRSGAGIAVIGTELPLHLPSAKQPGARFLTPVKPPAHFSRFSTMNDPQSIRRAALAASLHEATIFRGLSEDDLSRIASYSSRRSLRKDEILFEEGAPAEGFYVVTRGVIRAYRIGEGGREQLIHLIHAGESFAEPAIAGLPGYPAHARALVRSEVILVRGTEFLAHLQERGTLALRMLSSLSRHLHELVSTIESFKLRDAETRLLHWLLGHCRTDETAVRIHMHIPKATLASQLGTRPETLSRIFSKLRESSLIEVRGRTILIPDSGRLRERFASLLAGQRPSEG